MGLLVHLHIMVECLLWAKHCSRYCEGQQVNCTLHIEIYSTTGGVGSWRGLLRSTGRSAQRSLMTWRAGTGGGVGGRLKWEDAHVYIYVCVWALSRFSRVPLFATPWTITHQAPLSMGFSRQEHWSELPCPPLGDLPNPEIEPRSLMSPAPADGLFTTSATWETQICVLHTADSHCYTVEGNTAL